MATGNSGSFTLPGSDGFSVVVLWSETYNESANTHVVSVDSIKVKSSRYDEYAYYPTGGVYVNGSQVATFDASRYTHSFTIFALNTEYAIESMSSAGKPPWVSGTITGNMDGTMQVPIRVQMTCITGTGEGGSGWTVDGSSTITLHTISRATMVTVQAGTLGEASEIRTSRYSNSFTHTITYSIGSTSGTIVTKSNQDTLSWTPPVSLANEIPNSTTGILTINCYTYYGNTLIGTSTTATRMQIPESMVPTIGSFTATRVDGAVPSSWGIYVQSKSKATLTISGAAGSYSSTIKAYSISGPNFSSAEASATTGYLNASGNITFTAKVQDSRGRWSQEQTVTIYVYPYTAPYFLTYTADRCDSSGTITKEGTYVRSFLQYSYSTCNGKNAVSRATYYKKASVSTWTNANYSFSSGYFIILGDGNISPEETYDIKFTLTDAFGTTEVITSVSTASVVMDFKAGGTGVAVGKVSETDNAFEVAENWDVLVYGMLLSSFIKQCVNGIYYGTCASGSTAVEKAVTCTGFTLKTGSAVLVRFTYANTATTPTLNVNSTGAYTIMSYGNTWRGGQTVLFVFSGSAWNAVLPTEATTTYYGLVKLSNSVSSTSTGLAATAYAVKQAYDRNSWASISLTNALAIAYGGTGSTTAADARTNLGIAAYSLYEGTLSTGSITFEYGSYNFYVIIASPTSTGSRNSLVVPAAALTGDATPYQVADENYYLSINLSYSGTTVTLSIRAASGYGRVYRVFGVN